MGPRKPRILFIDAYDSFSNNIISLLETNLGAEVHTVKIDDKDLNVQDGLAHRVQYYDAVVCGPGPGHPSNKRDIGLIGKIWLLQSPVPVLGICLGFQSLCLAYGANIKRMKGPQHGIVRSINHVGLKVPEMLRDNTSIFRGVGELHATLYQSLCADIGQHQMSQNDWETEKWRSTKRCPDLLPLAWVENDLPEDECAASGIMDGRVLVGVRHRTRPFWALQYHPESICTKKESATVIVNWFQDAERWNFRHSRKIYSWPLDPTPKTLLGQYDSNTREAKVTVPYGLGHCDLEDISSDCARICHSLRLDIPSELEITDIVELCGGQDYVLLESTNARRPELAHPAVRGRYSIIGLNIRHCKKFEYRVGEECVKETRTFKPSGRDDGTKYVERYYPSRIWPHLAGVLKRNRIYEGPAECPFWGGIIGLSTYELGLEGIDVERQSRPVTQNRPDACFVQVEECLVIDHERGFLYLEKIGRPEDKEAIYQELANTGIPLKDVVTHSHSRCPVTFSNVPRTLGHSVFLSSLKRANVPPPISCEYVYKRGVFTGVVYADFSDEVMATLNNFEIYGQEIHFKRCSERINLDHEFWKASNTTAAVVRSIYVAENEAYKSKVVQCQEYISSGDSYELCLTDQSTVERQKDANSWELYKKLREKQPAPFASYMRLGGATFVSASPERFLKWDQKGKCELRPMKGTVRKGVGAENLEQAQALLDVPKERAENLMIVDLVRHDLYGICGSGNVSVPKLMVVEEYQSVFQMISIVQGQLPKSHKSNVTGLDVLATSLPPGSMTGAPKKRSCEILQEIEKGKERSLYSGVVGYFDFGGRGDWSVNIRCMFKWDDEDYEEDFNVPGEKGHFEKWHIGAGGAVTTLSTAEGETDEMLTKLSGTLSIFEKP